ncbi:3-dehydroquinate synthase [Convivina praedatoris]|uniref:3-dehydroquinate synthase n=1 Tax=Convivina praedatoris TaxID=2880963 RepID=A0ABN8H8Z5_9LACO|nr:3-dehydroquinate synthase [Convivina sp. LMG 32447]CAH1852094.1 3-dehydroquinate synthase [Convivina sp. LMG 32447]CAH1853876.1 3-dehydroquinate synthase [Convivina sp. LMG 32447]CAH1854216.1 3-dehydroquinate synthase [Convivina sp. LMG 32447]
MTTVKVKLTHKNYDVKIEKGLHQAIGEHIRSVWQPRKVVLITDSNVGPLYLSSAQEQLEKAGFEVLPIEVPAGESSKSLTKVGEIISQMAQAGFTRQDGVISLGGGMVGDLSGVVASLYMRGIAFIQVATSLTAQVDSSVGGKTAVNLGETKNIAGTFYQPDLVLVDSDYLDTLTDRDLVEGYGEVVKTSALEGQDFFDFTGKIRSVQDIRDHAPELSKRSIAYKAKVVMGDEKEAGQRRFLNFGHTFGHAIELLSHGSLRHGEAVAIGMVTITRIFEAEGISPQGLTQALIDRLQAVGLPISSDLVGTPLFFQHMINDKKNRGGVINMVALAQVGQPVIVPKPLDEIRSMI